MALKRKPNKVPSRPWIRVVASASATPEKVAKVPVARPGRSSIRLLAAW